MDDPNSPATKQDLKQAVDQLRSEMQHHADQLRSEAQHHVDQLRSEAQHHVDQLRSEMQHQYDDLKETLRDGQTEILKAFYGYAQTTDAKLKDCEVADIAARQRLSAVESRLLEIEKQIHLPPTQ